MIYLVDNAIQLLNNQGLIKIIIVIIALSHQEWGLG